MEMRGDGLPDYRVYAPERGNHERFRRYVIPLVFGNDSNFALEIGNGLPRQAWHGIGRSEALPHRAMTLLAIRYLGLDVFRMLSSGFGIDRDCKRQNYRRQRASQTDIFYSFASPPSFKFPERRSSGSAMHLPGRAQALED